MYNKYIWIEFGSEKSDMLFMNCRNGEIAKRIELQNLKSVQTTE